MIQAKLAALKDEVGKPRSDRGAKVRAAAIRFEEHFRGREFTAREFDEWRNTEPTLAVYKHGHKARAALKQAGTRDDMPQPFHIMRTAQQSWAVWPIEKLILSDHMPVVVGKQFKKWDTVVNHALQAADLDALDHGHSMAIQLWYVNWKAMRGNALATISNMATMVAMLEEGDLFALTKPKE